MRIDRNAVLTRTVTAILAVGLVAILSWAFIIALGIGRQAAYYAWLDRSGDHITARVAELGVAGPDGSALQVWVTNPGGTNCGPGPLFIDLSRAGERITRPSRLLPAVVSCAPDSPLENGPDGVGLSALSHNFVPDFAWALSGPIILALMDIAGLVLIRRSTQRVGLPAEPVLV